MARGGKEYQYQHNDRAAAIRRRRELVRKTEIMRNAYEEEEAKKEKVQAKLEINEPGDKHEQEADAVAKAVISGSASQTGIQKSKEKSRIAAMRAAGYSEEKIMAHIEKKRTEKNIAPAIQKRDADESGSLMAKGDDGGLNGTTELQTKLEASKGGGESLDDKTKGEMESKMGAGLSDVKIHTGTDAHEMAEGINAKAFTHGQDIYFKDGNYDTNSSEGKELLAHELVHTQQQKDGVERKVQRQAEPDNPNFNVSEAIEFNRLTGVNIYASSVEFRHLAGHDYTDYYNKIAIHEKEEESFAYLVYGGQKTLFPVEEEKWNGKYNGETLNAKNQWFIEAIKFNKEFYEFSPDLLNSLVLVSVDSGLGDSVNQDSPRIGKNFALLVLEVQQKLYPDDPTMRDGKLKPELYESVQRWYSAVNLKEVEVIAGYQGNIDQLVIDIHDSLNDKEKLNKIIPDSLTPSQKDELEVKYETKYGSSIPSSISSRFVPTSKIESFFSKQLPIAQSLAKISKLRKELPELGVSFQRRTANVAVVNNEITYKFNGTYYSAPRQQLATPNGTFSEFINPRTYTPRVIEWYAFDPYGEDFDKKHPADAKDEDYSFTPEKKGLYTVIAVVKTGNNAFEILKEIIEVTDKENIAAQQFELLGDNSNAFSNYVFNIEFAAQTLHRGVNTLQPESNIEIFDGYNPYYGEKEYFQAISYVLKKEPEKAASYLWYAVPDDQDLIDYQEGLENIGQKNQFLVDFNDGKYKIFDVIIKNGKKAIVGMGGVFCFTTEGNYTIYCETRDDEGNLLDLATYRQVVLSPENYKKLKELEKFKVKLNERVSEIQDGTLEPISAVYVNKKTSTASVIPLFIGKSKADPKKYLIIDLTPKIEKSKYEGKSFEDAIDHFGDKNSYPEGDIYIKYKSEDRHFKTTGETDYEAFSKDTGLAALGLAVVGGILTFLAPPVGVSMLAIAGSTATNLAIVSMILSDVSSMLANWEKDEPDATLTAVNILGLAWSLMAAGKIVMKITKTEGVLLAGRVGRLYNISELSVQGIQAVLITKMAAAQIDEINEQAEKNHWSKEQTQAAIMRLLAQLVVTHAVVIYSIFRYKSDMRGLLRKGLSDEEVLLMKPDEVILINSQLGADEIAKVGGTGAARIQRLKELAITKYSVALNIYGVDESKITLIKNAKGQLTYPINAKQFAGKIYTFNPEATHIQERIKVSKNPALERNRFEELFRNYPEGIKFTPEGFPDFSPYIVKYKGVLVEKDIGKLTPTREGDFALANEKMKADFPEWVQPLDCVWHHVEFSAKLQLVPRDVHEAFSHTGGVGTNK